MGNIKSNAILTDQCGWIVNNIEKKLHGVLHRFCAWHITHKSPTKWGGRENKELLTKNVKEVICISLTPEEFVQR
jgi:hypothetical protein